MSQAMRKPRQPPHLPPIETRWKPGQSGNPSGKRHIIINSEFVRELIQRLSLMSKTELQELLNNPKSTMIELQFASAMIHATKTGDYSRMDFLLNRMVGKVKENVSIEQVNPIREEIQQLATAELLRIVSTTVDVSALPPKDVK